MKSIHSLLVVGVLSVAALGCAKSDTAFSPYEASFAMAEPDIVEDSDPLPPVDEPKKEEPKKDPPKKDCPKGDRGKNHDRDSEKEENAVAETDLTDCLNSKPGKVLVCHVPAGNPAARHTICVSKMGAVHGHGLLLGFANRVGGHGGDTLGACEE